MTCRADGVKFRAILADPPWSFTASPGRYSNKDNWFSKKHILSLDDIASAVLPTMDDSFLFLWSPPAMLLHAIDVMVAWGYKYITNAVWVKMCKDGITPWMGMGYCLRNSHELLLVGKRGRITTNSNNVRSVILTRPLFGNGTKPDDAYAIVERISGGPYLELFARTRRDGWFAYGNELEGGSDISIPAWDELQK